jgi:hypothetical protein
VLPALSFHRLESGTHFQWQEEYHDAFLARWTMTTYGQVHHQPKVRSNPHWNSKHRTSEAWAWFYQCATIEDGTPAMYCKACKNSFVHPNRNRSGTSSLVLHMDQCRGILDTNDEGAAGEPSRKSRGYTLYRIIIFVLTLF